MTTHRGSTHPQAQEAGQLPYHPLTPDDWAATIPELVRQALDARSIHNWGEHDVSMMSGPATAASYAGISVNDSASGVTVIAGSGVGNKVQFLFFDTNDPSNLATPDHSNDHITILRAGDYRISVAIAADSGAGAAADYGFSVWKNNGATEIPSVHAHRSMAGGAGEIGSIVLNGYATLALNDTIELWVWNEDNTTNIELTDVSLCVESLDV